MFSSNPFPHLPSSTNNNNINVFPPSNSLFDNEKDDVHLDPFISSDFHVYAYNSPANVTTAKQDSIVVQYSEDHQDDLLDSVISPYKKKLVTSTKDGRSKIYTAQGPRDRRVRLSIEIARKFFCLQDLLGLDKASKTLDWLLTKSLIAIKDLVQQTNNCSSSTVADESKAKFLETIQDNGKKKKSVVRPKCVDGKKKKMILKCKGGFQDNVARDQSRAEARVRARERTKEKLRVKKLDGRSCESSSWGQIEPQNDHKDSSFQIRAFHEQMGDRLCN